MKYLIIGAGGTGGAIGGFLAHEGCDVSFIARGANLEAINKNGLKIKSGINGEFVQKNISAFEEKECNDKYDVIFVCVKGYSLMDIVPVIEKASTQNTVVIPTLNLLGTGNKLAEKLPNIKILDGCVYISAFINAPGEIVQLGENFKIIFGKRTGVEVDDALLETICKDINNSGIKGIISDNIYRDTFKKFSFISAFGASGAYFDATAGDIQHEGKERDTFKALVSEIINVGKKMGVTISDTLLEEDVNTLDSFVPEITTSLQKDLQANKKSEIDTLIFEIVRLGRLYDIPTPTYTMIAEKFGFK